MALRLEVAKEEAATIPETGVVRLHEITPSMLIQNGLELEDQQCVQTFPSNFLKLTRMLDD